MDNTEVHFLRNPDFIFRKIVEETILVPVYQNVAEMDAIYTLNALGAFLWERLALPQPQAFLEAAVLEEFDVDPGTVKIDLDVFIQEMESIGAVKRV